MDLGEPVLGREDKSFVTGPAEVCYFLCFRSSDESGGRRSSDEGSGGGRRNKRSRDEEVVCLCVCHVCMYACIRVQEPFGSHFLMKSPYKFISLCCEGLPISTARSNLCW